MSEHISQSEKHPSPLHLQARFAILPLIAKTLFIRSLTTEGEQHLDDLESPAAVIAVDHARDQNLAYAALGTMKYLDVVLTGQSTHRSLAHDPMSFFNTTLIGDRFRGIATSWDTTRSTDPMGQKINLLNFSDSDALVDDINDGKSPIIATHSPLNMRPGKPPRPGMMAAVTALRTNSPVVPLAIRYEETSGEKPDATIVIGKPYALEPLKSIEQIIDLSKKRQETGELSTPETRAFIEGMHAIRAAGKEVFEKTDALL